MISQKKWNVKVFSEELVRGIAEGLKIPVAVAKVMANRGVSSLEEARLFVDADNAVLHNPFLLPDMAAAVKRIRAAVDKKEKILVYGDRDVDGITSICIMIRTLKSIGADPLWYIPSDEGYGVHNEVIERYAKEGVSLIVTVDCGISAVENVKFAKSLGLDVVVTDHHEPADTGIPEAVAVVDPKRSESRYPFVDMAGCAVSFKVCEALMQSFGKYFGTEMLYLGVNKPSDVDGVYELCAIKVINGIVAGTEELKFDTKAVSFGDDETRRLRAFSGFCSGAVIVSQNRENMMEKLNSILSRNGINEINCKTIDIEKYIDQENLAGSSITASPKSDGARQAAEAALDLHKRSEHENDLRMKFFRETNMDVVALGTIADIMPLVKENRVFVKLGLKQLAKTQKTGLKMLIDKCARNGKGGALSAKSVSWGITPVLNAAGRRGKAALSCELLLTDDPRLADKLINEILQLNTERKELQAENIEKFMPVLKIQCDTEKDKILIVTASGIEHGVTGIIASQIMRQYRRPTILLIIEGEEAMGAARSFEGFDILSAISKVSDILVKFGGHSQAAGLTVPVDKIDEFRARLKAIAENEISPEALVPTVNIDAELDMSEVTMELIGHLANLEPFGMGNPHPIFALKSMKIRELSRIGANRDHLKLKLFKNGGAPIGAVGWGLGFLEDDIIPQAAVDVAVQLEINTWQDKSSVQLLIEDMKLSEALS